VHLINGVMAIHRHGSSGSGRQERRHWSTTAAWWSEYYVRRHGSVVERVLHRSVTDEYETEGNGRAVSLSLSYAYEAWSVRKAERKTGRALETMPILGKLKFAQTIPIYGWKE